MLCACAMLFNNIELLKLYKISDWMKEW
jgi:hypothetical protein